MTLDQVAAFIASSWAGGFSVKDIQALLRLRGVELDEKRILAATKVYVRIFNENLRLGRQRTKL